MRRRWAGNGHRPRVAARQPTLPESLTKFVSDTRSETRPARHEAATGAGWMIGPLRDIALALLVAVIVALAGGRILQAW
jgi:hypothetical protein